jgi:hypothetical protein
MWVVATVAIAGAGVALWLLWRRCPPVDDRAGDLEDRWYGGKGYKPPEDE